MDYRNLEEANEIDSLVRYIRDLRVRVITELREKEKKYNKGIATVVLSHLADAIVQSENKEVEMLINRLKEL